jgi:hypothetical protein
LVEFFNKEKNIKVSALGVLEMKLKSDKQGRLNDLEMAKLVAKELSNKNNFLDSTNQIDAYLVDDLRLETPSDSLYLGNYIFINQNASGSDGKSDLVKKIYLGTDYTILYIDDSKTDPIPANTVADPDSSDSSF